MYTGLPALCVEPRSPTDPQEANPAYLSVVVGKVEVEVSGGDSLKTLLSKTLKRRRDNGAQRRFVRRMRFHGDAALPEVASICRAAG
jgi:hypothetical protein